MLTSPQLTKPIFFIAAALCLTPWIDPPLALLLGIIFSQTVEHPFKKQNSKWTKILLQISVVGLGFGMNMYEAAKAGQQGFLFTVATIFLTIAVGLLLGKALSIPRNITTLISAGTAICGGSAIAAVSPIIEAKEDEISVSLGTVFILNAIALFIFPAIGHYFNLSQSQFGLWAAIAIHDTSSVVGAATKYGAEALQIATTIKLARALWIIPLSFLAAMAFKSTKAKITIPYFILYFVIAMVINTLVPQMQPLSAILVLIAKKGLTLTLFLIGAGLSRTALKSVGVRPLILGVVLWILISVGSLSVILGMVE
ncbi:MAG: putative sulfate exporter family transporter [Bacteroidota bacterium]